MDDLFSVQYTILFFQLKSKLEITTTRSKMSQEKIDVNENLYQIDNVLTGLNYLLEEVSNRKDNIFGELNLDKVVKEHINTYEYKNMIASWVAGTYCTDIYRVVAFLVMEKIDDSIAEYINSRVDARLKELGIK
jgi:hypothetical protein